MHLLLSGYRQFAYSYTLGCFQDPQYSGAPQWLYDLGHLG